MNYFFISFVLIASIQEYLSPPFKLVQCQYSLLCSFLAKSTFIGTLGSHTMLSGNTSNFQWKGGLATPCVLPNHLIIYIIAN